MQVIYLNLCALILVFEELDVLSLIDMMNSPEATAFVNCHSCWQNVSKCWVEKKTHFAWAQTDLDADNSEHQNSGNTLLTMQN